MTNCDALVVGAGPAGLSAAIALVRNGVSVRVSGRAEEPGSGSGLTLWPNACAALTALNASTALERATELCGMQMSDQTGKALKLVSASEFRARFGYPGYVMLRRDLIDGLMDVLLKMPGPTRLVSVDDPLIDYEATADGYLCHLRSGTLHTRCLVGADGAASQVAARLRPRDLLRPLWMRVLRGIAPVDIRPHPADVLFGTGTQFGMFAMSGSTYWFLAFPVTAELAKRDPPNLTEALTGFSVLARELVRATPAEAVNMTDVFDRDPVPAPWGQGWATLVGDAAHLGAPTLGQGACQALEDAAALQAFTGEGITVGGLRAYELARAGRAAAFVRQSRYAARTGRSSSRTLSRIRNIGVRALPKRALLHQLDRQFAGDAPPR